MVEKKGEDFERVLRFGEYEFEKFLAQGGEGAVCRYKRTSDGAPVAVKYDIAGQNRILSECLFYRNFC